MKSSFLEITKMIWEEYEKEKKNNGDVRAIYYLHMNPVDPQDYNFPTDLDYYYLIENEINNYTLNNVTEDHSIGRNYF